MKNTIARSSIADQSLALSSRQRERKGLPPVIGKLKNSPLHFIVLTRHTFIVPITENVNPSDDFLSLLQSLREDRAFIRDTPFKHHSVTITNITRNSAFVLSCVIKVTNRCEPWFA